MNKETFKKVNQPTLLLYYYKDETHQDAVVKVSAMQKMFDESMKKQLEDLKKQYDANKPGEQQPTA